MSRASVTSLLRSPSIEIISTGWAQAGPARTRRKNTTARMGHLLRERRLTVPGNREIVRRKVPILLLIPRHVRFPHFLGVF